MTTVATLVLDHGATQECLQLGERVLNGSTRVDLRFAHHRALDLSGRLPERVVAEVHALAREECHALKLSLDVGLLPPIGDAPREHRLANEAEEAGLWDAVHLLFACLLGSPFTWSTIQSGYLFNDVIPVVGAENERSSRSSSNVFELHTEDAFSVYAGNFLVLQCRSNSARAATTLASLEPLHLEAEHVALLAEQVFQISPNVAHSTRESSPLPLLYGDLAKPYFRVNANLPTRAPSLEHEIALASLVENLANNTTEVCLEPGDHLFIDNQRLAHGRSPFPSGAIGSASRWLRRLYVSSDLRQSRHMRRSAESWTIEL